MGFNLQSDNDVLVRVGNIAKETSSIGRALREVDGAGEGQRRILDRYGSMSLPSTSSGIQASRYSLFSLGLGVDVRDKDAVSTEIERLLNTISVVVAADTDENLAIAVVDTSNHCGKSDVVHGS